MTNLQKYWKHLKIVCRHKYYVFYACCKAGIPFRGLVHDLSKFSPTEFAASAKHFQGTKSHIQHAKDTDGYSLAWQHHKRKNRHHWEYWTNFEKGKIVTIPIPPVVMAEMLCDWVGAGMAYAGGEWDVRVIKKWFAENKGYMYIHPDTFKYLENVINAADCAEDIYEYADPKTIAQVMSATTTMWTASSAVPYMVSKNMLATGYYQNKCAKCDVSFVDISPVGRLCTKCATEKVLESGRFNDPEEDADGN